MKLQVKTLSLVSRKEHQRDLPDVLRRPGSPTIPIQRTSSTSLRTQRPSRTQPTSAFSNPEYDKLFEQVKVMEDTPEREALIHRTLAIVVEECPVDIQLPPPRLRAARCLAKERQVPQHIGELREVHTGRSTGEGGLLEGRGQAQPEGHRPCSPWPSSS